MRFCRTILITPPSAISYQMISHAILDNVSDFTSDTFKYIRQSQSVQKYVEILTNCVWDRDSVLAPLRCRMSWRRMCWSTLRNHNIRSSFWEATKVVRRDQWNTLTPLHQQEPVTSGECPNQIDVRSNFRRWIVSVSNWCWRCSSILKPEELEFDFERIFLSLKFHWRFVETWQSCSIFNLNSNVNQGQSGENKEVRNIFMRGMTTEYE